jgi:predicted nucleic acid-binding protein
VNGNISESARQIRIDHGLKAMDALHVSTAIHHKCDEFHTYDWDEVKSEGKKILPLNGKIPNLKIIVPPAAPSALFY